MGLKLTSARTRYPQIAVSVGARRGIATVEWEASPADDVIADSVVALLMHAQSSAASIRLTSKPCRHPRDSEIDPQETAKKQRSEAAVSDDIVTSRLRFLHCILKEQFEHIEAVFDGSKATFEIQSDAGLESHALGDERKLMCTVHAEFLDELGHDARISVESKDEKLAMNIQECLRRAVATTNPIAL